MSSNCHGEEVLVALHSGSALRTNAFASPGCPCDPVFFFLTTFIIITASAAAARACPEASACNDDQSFEESDVIFQGRESKNNLIAKLLAAEGLAPTTPRRGSASGADLGQAPGTSSCPREDKEAAGAGPGASSSCPVEDKEGAGVAGLLFLAYLGAKTGRFFGPAKGLTGRRVERGGGSSSTGNSSISVPAVAAVAAAAAAAADAAAGRAVAP